MRKSARPGTFGDGDFEALRGAWSQPGAMTGMLNWYRAMRNTPRLPNLHIEPPALIVWGADDTIIGREAALQSVELCADARLEIIEHATHWMHHEEPERVGQLLLDFLAPDLHPDATPPSPEAH